MKKAFDNELYLRAEKKLLIKLLKKQIRKKQKK
jgi:hypothetical protein